MKRWSRKRSEDVESPSKVEAFLDEIESVCRKHGLSISHEDGQGAFEVDGFSDENIKWLRDAAITEAGEAASEGK